MDRRVLRSSAGFTLIEIMVVVVILGILATLVASNVIGEPDKAREQSARSEIGAFADAVVRYRLAHTTVPESFEDLAGADGKPRYVDAQQLPPVDPWGTDYRFELREGEVYIASNGKDLLPDTGDDITTRNYKVRKRRG